MHKGIIEICSRPFVRYKNKEGLTHREYAPAVRYNNFNYWFVNGIPAPMTISKNTK
jgi:hypothetical protein